MYNMNINEILDIKRMIESNGLNFNYKEYFKV